MKTFCIIGDERVFRSKSPAMFSAVMKRVGIKGVYTAFKVNPHQIPQAMQSLRALNVDGANIAVPYKEAIIPYLDVLSEGANIIGAINTVVLNNNEIKGYNTNAIGFMDTLEDEGFNAAGKTAIVFGAGGVSKAVVFILNWLRAENIILTGRNQEKISKAVKRVNGQARSLESIADQPVFANILINATSVSDPDEAPELAAMAGRMDLRDCELVVDLNYGLDNNFWKDMAAVRGIRFIDGLPILANQARRCFKLWTRLDVGTGEFIKALKDIS